MIYEYLFPLRTSAAWLGWLNVLRYVPFRIIMATLTAMLFSFFLSPWFIRELQKKQIGQVVRDDGPQSHKVKQGTPTMGGALILLSVLVPTILWCDLHNPFVWATTAVTAATVSSGTSTTTSRSKRRTPRECPAASSCSASSSTGNHFVEVCLDEGQNVWVMLHSGSRGIGNRIGTFFIEKAKEEMRRWHINLPDQDLAYLPEGSEFYEDYVQYVDWAQRYAEQNREFMLMNTFHAMARVFAKFVLTSLSP